MPTLTNPQELVVEYLEHSGCKIVQSPDPNGFVRFQCVGSEHPAGYVYPTGVVHIFSEHTAPFQSTTTSFYDVMTMARGETFASAILRHIKGNEKDKCQSEARFDAEVEKEPRQMPPFLLMMSSVRTPRCQATPVDTQRVLKWIKSPPKSWMQLREEKTLTDMKTKFTPCLIRNEDTADTIGWLDVDGKSNGDKDLLNTQIDLIKDDPRVFCIFRSLSRRGFAIGVGIHYTSAKEYEAAMQKAVDDFEKEYGITIDKTCIRFKQLRALSYDVTLIVRDYAQYYRGYTMLPEDLVAEMNKMETSIKGIESRSKNTTESFECGMSMMDELDAVYDILGIEVWEDAWTGKREYHVDGVTVKDMNAIYLKMLDKLMARNSNAYHLKKTELCDYVTTRIDSRDGVLRTVFAKPWDKCDRWGQLADALHLDDFDLEMFKLWMRQGAALLYNSGKPTDVQRNFMLILHSREQHIGKTELCKKLACGTGSFTQKMMDSKSKDAMMTLYTNWIYEYGELGSQFRKTDINTLKSFVTDSAVTYRRPYDRDSTQFPVRTSIIGTTNESDLFIDPSGNRRYLVIDCKWNRSDWDAINEIDFKQLWCQARSEWIAGMPITLSYEQQLENEARCRSKRVLSKEMYALIEIFKQQRLRRGLVKTNLEDANYVSVTMEDLLVVLRDIIKDVHIAVITRELENLGFSRMRTSLGDKFVMLSEQFEKVVDKMKNRSDMRIMKSELDLKGSIDDDYKRDIGELLK